MTTLQPQPHVSLCDPSDKVLTLVEYKQSEPIWIHDDIPWMKVAKDSRQRYAINNSIREEKASTTAPFKAIIAGYMDRKDFEQSRLIISNSNVRANYKEERLGGLCSRTCYVDIMYCPIFPHTARRVVLERFLAAKVVHYIGCEDHAQKRFLNYLRQRATTKGTKIEEISIPVG